MRRAATFLVLLIAGALGFLRWIDMVNFCDPDTGFVVMGEVWWRYAAMAGAALLFLLAGRLGAKHPRCFAKSSPMVGLWAGVCGVLWAALCGFKAADLMESVQTISVAFAVLYALTALWFFLMAASCFNSRFDPPSGSAGMGILGTLAFYLLVVYRFGVKPASVHRIPVTVELLSALAALLFVSAAVRAAYLPFTPCGKRLNTCGLLAFFFCTCLELPQTVFVQLTGGVETEAFLTSLALGAVGLLGGLCALAAAGKEAEEGSFGAWNQSGKEEAAEKTAQEEQ